MLVIHLDIIVDLRGNLVSKVDVWSLQTLTTVNNRQSAKPRRYVKQSGTRQYGHVWVRLNNPGKGYEFVINCWWNIPREYINQQMKATRLFKSGDDAGYPFPLILKRHSSMVLITMSTLRNGYRIALQWR